MQGIECTETEVLVRDMHVECRIGEHREERTSEQPVVLHLTMCLTDPEVPADDLTATVNYRTIEADVRQLLGESSFVSMEWLVQHVAQLCFHHPRIQGVTVEAVKPLKIAGCGPVGVRRTFKRAAPKQVGLAYIVLTCANTSDTRSFYELLGLRFALEQHGKRGAVHFAATHLSTVLELYPRRRGEPPCPGPRRLGIAVPDMDRALAAMNARYRRTGVSETSLLFVDPDGREVEITQA